MCHLWSHAFVCVSHVPYGHMPHVTSAEKLTVGDDLLVKVAAQPLVQVPPAFTTLVLTLVLVDAVNLRTNLARYGGIYGEIWGDI